MNDYAYGLLVANQCGEVARTKAAEHLMWRGCSYLGGFKVLEALSGHRSVFVIDTLSMSRDIDQVFTQRLAGKDPIISSSPLQYSNNTITIPPHSVQVPHERDNSANKIHSVLNESAKMILRGYLELNGEYWLHRELLKIAKNKRQQPIITS